MMQLIQRVKEQQGITSAVAWVCVACAVLIIAPSPMIKLSGTQEWSLNHMPYIWLLALVTGSYLATHGVIWLCTHFHAQFSERQQATRRNLMIQCLDFEEKALLREFVIQRKNVLALPMRELAVSNLMKSGVLVPAYETQEIKGSGRIIKLSIALAARDQLTYKVLGLPVGKLTEEEASELKAARPDYARSNYIALRD